MRRSLPWHLAPAHRAFLEAAGCVDRARRVMAEAAPTTRFAGRPFPDVLIDFEAALGEALGHMPGWRAPELEGQWIACDVGLRESLRLAERLRLEAPALVGFESLIGALDQLQTPLDVFEDAAERFRSLRATGRRVDPRIGS